MPIFGIWPFWPHEFILDEILVRFSYKISRRCRQGKCEESNSRNSYDRIVCLWAQKYRMCSIQIRTNLLLFFYFEKLILNNKKNYISFLKYKLHKYFWLRKYFSYSEKLFLIPTSKKLLTEKSLKASTMPWRIIQYDSYWMYTFSFIWNGRNKFLNNLQISGFISTESQ